jgi:hypothetical protein
MNFRLRPYHFRWLGLRQRSTKTRRKIIRQWMSHPKDNRQTAEQAAVFAKKAVEENELQHSRRADAVVTPKRCWAVSARSS